MLKIKAKVDNLQMVIMKNQAKDILKTKMTMKQKTFEQLNSLNDKLRRSSKYQLQIKSIHFPNLKLPPSWISSVAAKNKMINQKIIIQSKHLN